MPPKRRKLNRSSFKDNSPLPETEVQDDSPPPETEDRSAPLPQPATPPFLPVDENSEKIISFTWVDKPIFHALEKQKKYFCSAYVLIDWIQALYYQKYAERITISLQELIDNNADPERQEFNYAFDMYKALNWIQENGISCADDYKSTFAKQPPQPRKEGGKIIRVKGARRLKPTEQTVLRLLKSKPLPARLRYDGTTYYDLQLRKGKGVYRLKKEHYGRPDPYNQPNDEHMDHAILLVGWGTDEGVNYYEVRDTNREGAPNNGHYRVIRPSSLRDDEIDSIAYVLVADVE